jgi:hypothetical protein
MEKNIETGTSKIQSAVVWALIIGLLAGFFVGRVWKEKYGNDIDEKNEKIENVLSEETNDVSLANTKKEAVSSGSGTSRISVENQGAGATTSVSKVVFGAPGWVVVRENNGGEMGNILGALWLPVGNHENAVVELLRGTVSGKSYFVVLYNDNGDKKFNKEVDFPIISDGKTLLGTFSVN